jgi:hypothetical protein
VQLRGQHIANGKDEYRAFLGRPILKTYFLSRSASAGPVSSARKVPLSPKSSSADRS